MVVTQALGLSGVLQWGIRQSAAMENGMTSVERLIEYTEAESENDTGYVPKDWPNEGRITYKNVSLKYASNSLTALRNIDFVIEPKQKIGIIGRTGAGKSSIIATLFRLYNTAGSIIIDNYDIKTIKLSFLRSRLSIIPQDPVLFSGTLRSNLDPNSQYTDEVLWKALESVQIKFLFESLDDKIVQSGSNFSVGERQLICLTRAVIHRNKILVLDEATANVDPKTDAIIQSAIREIFSDCTVLTIAHKLGTVMDSDKIMLLDNGYLLEFDSPKNLLKDKESRFYSMAKIAGLV